MVITNYDLPITLVRANSIGQPLVLLLPQFSEHRVIARYDSTLQLETRNGVLWTITTRSNPAAMRLVAPVLPGWRDGTTVQVRDEKISGAGCELRLGDATRFDPVPRPRTLSTAQRISATQTIAGALARYPLPDALGFWDELSEMWEQMRHVIASPERAKQSPITNYQLLVTGDYFVAQDVPRNNVIHALLGRGPGLTPAGDDFLQALLVTLASGDAQDRTAFESLVRAVTPHLSRATRVSRAFLEEAMQGWAFGALKDGLDELPSVTQGKLDALLNIGATSGAAYVLGMLMGLSWKENSATEHTEVTETERNFSMPSMA